MKIPKTLKICGMNWAVEVNRDVANEGQCYGSMHFTYQKIYLDPNTTPQKHEQTLLHEILHTAWANHGLGQRKELKDFEEQIVDALSQGLYQVLKDNDMLK